MITDRAGVLFDPEFYASRYADIGKAVEAASLSDPFDHYLRHGIKEGRQAFQFDEAFYRTHYPQAQLDVEAGLVPDLRTHFAMLGYARGYLPYAQAPRPDDPAAVRTSKFGGMWLDQGDALDKIQGRLEIGQITEEEAQHLRHWAEKGYIVLEKSIPDGVLEAALSDFERMYRGEVRELLFLAEAINPKPMGFDPRLLDIPAKALDLHWYSNAICDLVLGEKVSRYLSLIFESKPLASQTLGFYRGSSQGGHQDSAYVTYSQQRAFAASWIALEDVEEGAGELFYYESSHKLPEFLYDGRHKSHGEATRTGMDPSEANKQVRAHVRTLPDLVHKYGKQEKKLIAKQGDVLFWHADLIHGGKPISNTRTRKSVVTHYSPWRVAPLYFERRKPLLREHDGKGYYTTVYYRE